MTEKSRKVSVRLTQQQYLALFLAVQEKQFVSVSVAIREIIDAFAESRKTAE